MFDFIRNLTKSEEEKLQETLSAYLDNALTPAERAAFETRLSADPTLRASLEQQQQIKQNVGQLPRLRAPRNFTLDPAAYGRPTSQTVFNLYPVMRGATALAAIMLIFLFSLQFFTSAGLGSKSTAGAPAAVFNQTESASDMTVDGGETAEEPAAAPEIVREEAGETAVAADEAAEAEVAEAEDALAPPAEEAAESAPETAAGAVADSSSVQATEQPLTATVEVETESANTVTTTMQNPAPTITLRTSPTTTQSLYSSTDVVGSDELIPTVESQEVKAVEKSPISTLSLLQIGLGVLFIILLAATLILRRQL
ncbi:MAG: zf-HC2 domain-containing protein [Candidatus Promineifilaceae bacterium]